MHHDLRWSFKCYNSIRGLFHLLELCIVREVEVLISRNRSEMGSMMERVRYIPKGVDQQIGTAMILCTLALFMLKINACRGD
jgi:hypothetical protein